MRLCWEPSSCSLMRFFSQGQGNCFEHSRGSALPPLHEHREPLPRLCDGSPQFSRKLLTDVKFSPFFAQQNAGYTKQQNEYILCCRLIWIWPARIYSWRKMTRPKSQMWGWESSSQALGPEFNQDTAPSSITFSCSLCLSSSSISSSPAMRKLADQDFCAAGRALSSSWGDIVALRATYIPWAPYSG